jgi:hypothetical protein
MIFSNADQPFYRKSRKQTFSKKWLGLHGFIHEGFLASGIYIPCICNYLVLGVWD